MKYPSNIFLSKTLQTAEEQKAQKQFIIMPPILQRCKYPLLLHILIIPFHFRCQQTPAFQNAVPTAQLREEARVLELSQHLTCTHHLLNTTVP